MISSIILLWIKASSYRSIVKEINSAILELSFASINTNFMLLAVRYHKYLNTTKTRTGKPKRNKVTII